MSSSSSGIGIGGIIFWGFILYSIFGGGDDADKKDVEVKTTNKPAITETIEKQVNDLGDKINEATKKISISLDLFVKKEEKEEKMVAKSTEKQKKVVETEKAKKDTTEKANDDPYENNDLYGSVDDKW